MIYDFVDINEQQTNTYLPAEAVSLNGTYLENIIEGYRTLYVKGRESLKSELDTYSVGVADGERIKGSRYPSRKLTVGFQILAKSDEDFRIAFNQLNNILSVSEADFIFNDETDKFFTGTPLMDAEIEAGRNNVTGEWHIFCGYPFKRSVEPITLSTDDEQGVVVEGNTATFSFEYNGSYPSKPLLRATFASALEGGDYNEDGDCGYVAFFDDEENIIQLGNPDVIDVDQMNKNDTLVNSAFDDLTDWTADGLTVASITDTYWDKGKGQTQNYAKGAGTLTRNTTGAVNFEFDIVHRLAVNKANQTGSFRLMLQNNGTTIIGFTIAKTGNGTQATVSYIVNGRTVGTDKVDIGYYNTAFGYCKRTARYVQQTYKQKVVTTIKKGKKKVKKTTYVTKTRSVQKGWNYTQANLNSGISRDGSTVTFSIGNLKDRTFKDAEIENVPVYDIKFQTTGNFHTNAIRSAALILKKGVPFAEIPNVFTAGDIVEADCSDANVYLYRNGGAEGHLEPQYGALGNDWEDFSIKAGTNVIACSWSGWVDANYKPKIEIIFNEVNI